MISKQRFLRLIRGAVFGYAVQGVHDPKHLLPKRIHLHKIVEGSSSIILRIAQVQAQICLCARKNNIKRLTMLIGFDNLNYVGIVELFDQL
jgi:hypothetical protein